MSRIDDGIEAWLRGLARRTSRRSLLGRWATLFVGASALPLLPVARASAQDAGRAAGGGGARVAPPDESIEGDAGDPTKCDYWRHCAIDGFLCACCGGSATQCPPGTEMSPVTWIGTCRNPADGLDYIISYNDCCGKHSCGQCACTRNDSEEPMYRPFNNNDINWCLGAKANVYNCTVAVIRGVASA